MMEKILEVRDVEKYYGYKGNITKAVDGISFDILQGEFVGIMGASGSGKTTTLNCISTIDKVTAGSILIEGQDITSLKRRALSKFRRDSLGFIFQDFNLLDTLTGFENIALALTVHHVKPKEIESRIQEMAKTLKIEDIIHKYPYQMSGGEKQRVASARAMITNPKLVLADEPTGALDTKSSRNLLNTFEKLNQDLKATILMVTHDPMAASYCHRILFIKDGKLFNAIDRGDKNQKVFYRDILDVLTLLGGDNNHVI